MVNHVLPLSQLIASNVVATKEALMLCSSSCVPKKFVLVSTASVGKLGGYAESKALAEVAALEAERRGLNVRILRPGRIGPSFETGCFNDRDLLYRILLACFLEQAAPSDPCAYVSLIPVDKCANAIVSNTGFTSIHVAWSTLCGHFKVLSDHQEWFRRVRNRVESDGVSHPLAQLLGKVKERLPFESSSVGPVVEDEETKNWVEMFLKRIREQNK